MNLNLIARTGAKEILIQLESGPKRFSEFRELNKRTMQKRLIELEEAGLIRREVITERPVKVIYKLTRKGNEIIQDLKRLERKLKSLK
ncbi:MAG: winged helix-turn-helix transcriptional regulator [Methanobacteriota archaeon]